jgi:hypothetical protein
VDANPFAPPSVAVTDALPRASAPKPRDVVYAVRLLWVAIAIGVTEAITVLRSVAVIVPVLIAATIGVPIVFGLFALIILGLSRGKNWVRWLFTVIVALNCVQSYRILPGIIAASELRGIASLAQDVLNVIAVALLHTRSSRAWFTRTYCEAA